MSGSDQRVVIVGGSGFVGRSLGRHLQREGLPVLSMSSNDADLRAVGAGAKLARMLEPADALVMAAALTPDRGRDVTTLLTNISIANETCDALVAARPAFAIYVSSDAVYVDGVERVNESTCAQPSTFHGLMHLTREAMFQDAAARSGTQLLVLRPSAVYGPGDTHGSYGPNRFVRTALADGKISLFGQGEERRDHLFIRDLCRVIESSLRQRLTGTLNVATGTSVTFMELAELVARLAPRRVELVRSPRAPGAPVTHRAIEVSALRAAIPELRPTALEDGVRETIAAAGATA